MTETDFPESPGVALPESFHLLRLGAIDSTNAEALRLAQSDAPAGTLVWAQEQTAGRGRRGRDWASPPGNLYCSLLLYPSQPPDEAAQLSFVAALALADSIAEVAPGVKPEIKWPNDVLVGGRKIAGILLEGNVSEKSGRGSLVIGSGVNISSHPDFPDGLQATSLAREGAKVGTQSMLEHYAAALAHWIGRWEADGFAPIRAEWVDRAAGIGREIEIRLAGKTLSGYFRAVDDAGALIVSTREGDQTVNAAEVFLLGPARPWEG